MKILIMGLPGSGKTTMATRLESMFKIHKHSVTWINADRVRSLYQDWDFSHEGRIRQAQRLADLANVSDDDYTIVDFVAPLQESRDIFDADFTIWMDTIVMSRYEDTDQVFKTPKYDLRIQDNDYSVDDVYRSIINMDIKLKGISHVNS
jgi:adenylylsulfate kinase